MEKFNANVLIEAKYDQKTRLDCRTELKLSDSIASSPASDDMQVVYSLLKL